MPDDHSVVEPPLPIPNRTVKRHSADDSEPALVKVGHRQAVITKNAPGDPWGVFSFGALLVHIKHHGRPSIQPSI